MEIPWNSHDEAPEIRAKPQPGTYRFEVKEGKEGYHEASGTPVLKLKCKTLDDKQGLFFDLYFTEKTRYISKKHLTALGVPEGMRLEPWMLVGTRFEAICRVEKSKPNANGKVFDNLKVDSFDERPGFTHGIRLVERSHNLPQKGDPRPDADAAFRQTRPASSDDVPF